MAVNIKIDKWLKGEQSYLSFIRGLKEISQYFRTFVGCKPTESNAVITRKVIDSVRGFVEVELHEEEQRREREYALYDLMKANQAGIGLRTIINTIFPEEVLQEKFYQYLDEKKVEISYDFIPDKRIFNSLVQLIYKTQKIDLKLNYSLFDENLAEFQTGTNYLVLKDPLIKQRYDELTS